MDTENPPTTPEYKDYAPGKACAEPRNEFAESESFLSKFLRAVEREKDELPEWEELVLRELIGNSARYGWNAWGTEENARRYEEAFYAYLQSLGCPEGDPDGNAWTRLSGTPDAQAEIGEFQRIADFYEPDDVNFGRDKDSIQFMPEERVAAVCDSILTKLGKAKPNREYHGCTVQGAVETLPPTPYARPWSKTYLSTSWKGKELENVKSHEDAHGKIITLGQLIGREIARRRILGIPTLSDSEAHSFEDELNNLHEILDNNEEPVTDPSTGELHLRRKVDVVRELKKLHCRFLRKLHDLEQGR